MMQMIALEKHCTYVLRIYTIRVMGTHYACFLRFALSLRSNTWLKSTMGKEYSNGLVLLCVSAHQDTKTDIEILLLCALVNQ